MLLAEAVDSLKKEKKILSRSLSYKSEEVGIECAILYAYGEAREDAESLRVQLKKCMADMKVVEHESTQLRNELDAVAKQHHNEVNQNQELQIKCDRQDEAFANYEENLAGLQRQKLELEKKYQTTVNECANVNKELEELKGITFNAWI